MNLTLDFKDYPFVPDSVRFGCGYSETGTEYWCPIDDVMPVDKL